MTNVAEVLKTSLTELNEAVPKFKEISDKGDEFGAKCATDGLKKPDECFMKHYPGDKKSEKDYEKE